MKKITDLIPKVTFVVLSETSDKEIRFTSTGVTKNLLLKSYVTLTAYFEVWKCN